MKIVPSAFEKLVIIRYKNAKYIDKEREKVLFLQIELNMNK